MACPFGVPEVYDAPQIMMKCDMCYDRSSVGKKPMCATVCPSQALFYGTHEDAERLRPNSVPTNQFRFGLQTITTGVFVMTPRAGAPRTPVLDVTAAMDDRPAPRMIPLRLVPSAPGARVAADLSDPYGEVKI
jgi:Fe-S-cluster-containing dehydrogenase component